MSDQVAWAAGVIEGEGCFALVKNYKARLGKTAKITVQMNDLDIIERLQSIFEAGRIYYRPPRKTSKESWVWTVYKAADVLKIIKEVQPWLGSRRNNKAKELVDWITSV